jgi:hypothetical protein
LYFASLARKKYVWHNQRCIFCKGGDEYMRREIGNTLTAGVIMGAVLLPAGCGGNEHPTPNAASSFACNFERPSDDIVDHETTAIRGLAMNMQQRYDALAAQYHLDGGKPHPNTAVQMPLKDGSELMLAYYGSDHLKGSTQADPALADHVSAVEYTNQKGQDPRYWIDFDQLCNGGWMASWQENNGSITIGTDANYAVYTKMQPEASPGITDDAHVADSVITQLVGQAQQLINLQPGDELLQLSEPSIK